MWKRGQDAAASRIDLNSAHTFFSSSCIFVHVLICNAHPLRQRPYWDEGWISWRLTQFRKHRQNFTSIFTQVWLLSLLKRSRMYDLREGDIGWSRSLATNVLLAQQWCELISSFSPYHIRLPLLYCRQKRNKATFFPPKINELYWSRKTRSFSQEATCNDVHY